MSTSYDEKLKAIRKAEGLTQTQLSDLTGIGLSTIKNYETKLKDVGLGVIEKVLSVPELQKYTLWLMTDQTAPESGQIAPPAKFLDEDAKRKKTIN
ncbi:XRE family transcriptional regulator [Salmonella enterica subsp. enterica serovar Oranienburg]|nr:XRE family transcriptional regulator [Salmonella enterica subsp. enterica serovar Oranienburg]EGL2187715.1 helix-turn-helix transcriptional regulator [Salmonella enterica subsp. enterica serovar Agbeni]EID1871346.1 helix-turn-helix transcriptional regulator [Salmonella enterica subsp. enterica]EBQ9820444.1 XRE family transcriptional regulator [Salmonella enterica subsp. enterica serovar Oranienburg]EBU7106098.1 XRE family transcriptional regulator [Salmonella enterica subsp. enterica serovar